MSMSEELQKQKEWSLSEDVKLRADDKRFNNKVHIVHEDGSVFIVMNAFLVDKGKWLFVFAEHHDSMIFYKEDLVMAQEYPQKLKDIPVGDLAVKRRT